MTKKAQAIRSQLPAQPSDAAPPPTSAAGAPPNPPPDDPPPAGDRASATDPGERPVVTAAIHRLSVAQALPEVDDSINTLPVAFAPGSIERFKSAEDDRRTMSIVALPDGSLAKRVVPTTEVA